MAIPAFPRGHVNPVFAVSADTTSPASIYIYARGISSGLMRLLIGYVDEDGAVVDGIFTDFLQALGASNNGVDLTAVTTELDTNDYSPNQGYVRMVLTTAATVS